MAEKYVPVVQVDMGNLDNGNTTFTELVDTDPTTQSRCQRSEKFLLKIILVISVLCNIGFVIHILILKRCNDDSEPMPFTNNTKDPLTGNNEDGACIYNTSAEFLKELDQDPFGDLCRRDSPICQKGGSTHACKSCGNEKEKFPSFCFCDKKVHCNHTHGEMPFDCQRKSDCSDCLGIFRLSQFNASGTCTCQKVSLQCDCHEGFSGFMCSSIVLRYCKSKDNIEPEIPHCKDSNEERCQLNQDGKYYLCVAFDDSNRKQRRSATSCENIVTT